MQSTFKLRMKYLTGNILATDNNAQCTKNCIDGVKVSMLSNQKL